MAVTLAPKAVEICTEICSCTGGTLSCLAGGKIFADTCEAHGCKCNSVQPPPMPIPVYRYGTGGAPRSSSGGNKRAGDHKSPNHAKNRRSNRRDDI